jgi:PAS domain S-box-containing protein
MSYVPPIAERHADHNQVLHQLTLELTNIGTWEWHIATNKIYWNDNHYRLMGLAPEGMEVTFETWQARVHPQDFAQAQQKLQWAIDTHTDYQAEYRVIYPNGDVHWVEARGRAVYQLSGQPERVLGVVFDISDRKQVETELKSSEERLQLALTASGDGLWDWNVQTGELYFNARWLLMLGYSNHALPGDISTWQSLLHPDDVERITAILAAHLADVSVAFACEYRLKSATGEWVWIADYGKVVAWDSEGRPLRMIGTHRDISEKKQAETALQLLNQELEARVEQRTKALKESQALFRNAFEQAVNGMALIALSGEWMQVNMALCNLLGYSESELLDIEFSSLLEPAEIAAHRQSLQQLLCDETASVQIERELVHKQGHRLWVISSISLVREHQGLPLYFVLQVQDITERRVVEQIKRDFISVVSHELRTPLTAIRGALGLLASGVLDSDDDSKREMLSISDRAADRLVRLVNDILDLERLESKKLALNCQNVSVDELITQAITSLDPLAQEQNITLQAIPSELSVRVDCDRIHQVLVNLISNAIKFSPPHTTIELAARLWCRDPLNPVSMVCFSVKDQGRGIPSQFLNSIFGRFQQVDSSDARDKGGTGLGLTICKNIVQQHGGQIWVESVLGQGSVFYFTVPSNPSVETHHGN